jgi:hypothetical protein
VLDGQPRRLAEHLVAQAWAQKPALFEGKAGPRPHKLAASAIALAVGVRAEARQHNSLQQDVYLLALMQMLDEIAHKAAHLPFHELDLRLLDAAAATVDAPCCSQQDGPLIDWFGL